MNLAEVQLRTPISEAEARGLRCGQVVRVSGRIYTARDAAHKYLASPQAELPPEVNLAGGVVYHCGPVMIKTVDGGWHVTAAGPTTSAREEPYMAEVIRRYGLRAVLGKGGMGEKTRRACQECGCVYLSAVGGAAQVLAAAVKRVAGVSFLAEFGSPEAIWALDVDGLPAIVTMDAHGGDVHAEVLAASAARLKQAEARGTAGK